LSGFIPTPSFPNVPDLPGVPALLRAGTGLVGSVPLLEVADATGILGQFASTNWGLFNSSGQQVVPAKSIISVDFRADYDIVDYPIEQGAFQSFNKVIVPFDIHLVMTCDGNTATRAAFMQALLTARKSLDIYSVTTPEAVFLSVNIIHVDLQRSAQKNANMIQVEVVVRQVNVTSTATLSSSANSSGADAQNGGTVQPTTPSDSQQSSATAAYQTGYAPGAVTQTSL
jgi:hypothetical protein